MKSEREERDRKPEKADQDKTTFLDKKKRQVGTKTRQIKELLSLQDGQMFSNILSMLIFT